MLKYIKTKFCIDCTTFIVLHFTQIKISLYCTAFQLLSMCFCGCGCYCLLRCGFVHTENKGSTFFQNVGFYQNNLRYVLKCGTLQLMCPTKTLKMKPKQNL